MNTLTAKLSMNWGRYQMLAMSVAMLLQRSPIARIFAFLENITRAPLSRVLQATVTALAIAETQHAVTGATTITLSPATVPAAETGKQFNLAFYVSGRTAGSWKVTGTIPPGLSIAGLSGNLLNQSKGTISGIPTQAGSYTVSVQPYENRNQGGKTMTAKDIVIKVTQSTPTTTFNLSPATPSGETGKSLTVTFSVAGMTAGSWKIVGSAPPGMTLTGPNGEQLSGGTLNAASGKISGTPTTAGTYDLTVQPYDQTNLGGVTDGTQHAISINIAQGVPTTTFNATPSATATATIQEAFNLAFNVSGMTPASWKLVGALPPGLSLTGPNGESSSNGTLNAASGKISGTPTTLGTYSFTVQPYDQANLGGVTDGVQHSISITVALPTFAGPLEEWKYYELGSVKAADAGDPDGDGLPNLLEYALGRDPNVADVDLAIRQTLAKTAHGECLTIELDRLQARNDISIIIEAAASLAGPWTPIAQSVNGAAFAGEANVTETDAGNGVRHATVTDAPNPDNPSLRFVRTRVAH